MKEIKAIIQPFRAEEVITALHTVPGLPGVTVSEVRGYGKVSPDNDLRKEDAEVFGSKKIKLEIVVPDELVEKVKKVISTLAHTGNPGDGKLFISTVDDVVKVRTGEHGESAI
jgi:nitrogen regulatory protein P-II 1